MMKNLLSISTCVMLAACLLVRVSVAADVGEIVVGYEKYKTVDFLDVDQGTVKSEKVSDRVRRVVIEVADQQRRTVTLTARGFTQMRLLDLRSGKRLRSQSNRIRLSLPPDRIGWYLLYSPPSDLLLRGFKPQSLLNVPGHPLRRAKYPVVDVHVHLARQRGKLEDRIRVMNQTNVAIAIESPMANAGLTTADSFVQFENKSPLRFLTFATIDFTRRYEPGFARLAIRLLREEAERFGVVGIGETHDKGSGLFATAGKPQRRQPVFIDDPRVMPIWKTAAELRLPILIHVGDPVEYYQPIDSSNDRFLNVTRSPWFYLGDLSVESADQVRSRLHHLLTEIPDLNIIAAHMESLSHDLPTLAKHLRRYPNLYVEIGNRFPRLASTPRVARKFFIEFQDRILFGMDGIQPTDQYRARFRILETDDDAFQLPGRETDFQRLYGLDLPDVVLKKVYYSNAAKLMPKVKRALLKQHPHLDFPK